MSPFKIIWQSMKVYYDEFFSLLLMGAATLLATLLIIPGPLALAGLWRIADNATEGKDTSWQVFWEGVKLYGPRNWLNTLLLFAGYALIALNLWFYSNPAASPLPDASAPWVIALGAGLGLIWTSCAFYLLTFQLRMTTPQLWLSLRNSFYLLFLHPINTFTFLLVLGVLLALCVVLPPLIFLHPGFTAVLSTVAVKTMLQPILERQKGAQAKE